MAFDTPKFVNRLKNAGVPPLQAEALSEVFEANLAELATKQDVDVKLANLKFELLKWIIGIAIAQPGLLIGLLEFLP